MPKGLQVHTTGSSVAGAGQVHKFLNDGSAVFGSGSAAAGIDNKSITMFDATNGAGSVSVYGNLSASVNISASGFYGDLTGNADTATLLSAGADRTKLDAIEASADVTDATNVTAAGALMDSEVTNLAQVKAFDSSDYATAAQGTTADAALPKAGGAMTGAITTNSTFDGRDVATDGTKLDGIEASADVTDTVNVTAAGALMDSELTSIADVKALDQSVVSGATPTFTTTNFTDASNKRLMTDAQETKLDSVESSADVTDTVNVTAAGALMDSELTSIADVKALNQSVISGATPTFTTTNFTDASDKRLMTDAQETKLDSVETNADVTDTANVKAALGAEMPSNALALGDSSSTITIPGNLTVAGTTTTLNTATVNIADHNIVLDSDNGTSSVIDGAGITIEGGSGDDVTLSWVLASDRFDLKKGSSYAGLKAGTFTGNLTGDVTGDASGNAGTATKIASITNSDIVQLTATQTLTNKSLTSPTITGTGAIAGTFTGNLTGDVTGNASGNAGTATKIASITNSNIVQLADTQTLTNKTIDADNNTLSNLEVDNFKAATIVLEGEGIGNNDNDTTIPTSAAVKDYVDTQVTAQDLDFQGDSGGALAIDLDSETLDIAGGTGLTTVGSGNTLTVNLDNTAVTPAAYGSTTAVPVITVDAQGRITAASTAAIATSFDIDADSGTSDTVAGGETLTFAGTANEIETTVSNNQIQIGLPDDVTTTNITASGYLSASTVYATTLSVTNLSGAVDGNLVLASDADIVYKIDADGDGTNNYTFQTGETSVAEMDEDGNFQLSGGLSASLGLSGSELWLSGVHVTSTAAELNLLAGVAGLVQADFTKLAAVDATATELNLIDGATSAGTTAVADGHGIIMNHGGTMAQTTVQTLAAYLDDKITAMPNLVEAGDLDAGSITANFGTIDNGSSTLNTGAATVDSLSVSSGGITNAGSIAGATTIDGTGDLTMGTISMTGFTVDGSGNLVAASAQVSDLTDNRVVVAGTSGELEDSANLTFDGSTLTVGGDAVINGTLSVQELKSTTVTQTELEVSASTITMNEGSLTDLDATLAFGSHGSAASMGYAASDDSLNLTNIAIFDVQSARIDLDSDNDTSIRASADDVITFEIGGSDELVLNGSALEPASDEGLSLGTSSKQFSQLKIASGGSVDIAEVAIANTTQGTHGHMLLLGGSSSNVAAPRMAAISGATADGQNFLKELVSGTNSAGASVAAHNNFNGVMFYLSAKIPEGTYSDGDAGYSAELTFNQAGKFYFVEGDVVYPSPFTNS